MPPEPIRTLGEDEFLFEVEKIMISMSDRCEPKSMTDL
jgi:hypothetical protein